MSDFEKVELDQDEIDEEEAYARALDDFTERLIVVELPEESDEKDYEKYVKQMCSIKCVLGLINHELKMVSPLPDDFEAPYDNITLWTIAVKNSIALSFINKEASKPDDNIYIVQSYSGRGLVCCDGFWDNVCKDLNTIRLIISMYRKDKSFVIASAYGNDDEMDTKIYLDKANKEDESRISYVYVRNVGMLSEAALNSID